MSTPNAGSSTETKIAGGNSTEEAALEKFDFFCHLPTEIRQMILLSLSSEDFQTAMSACPSWRAAVSNNDYFWKRCCRREGYLEMNTWNRSEFYNNFFKEYSYWEAVYEYNYTLQQNWKTGNCKEYNLKLKLPNDPYNSTFLGDLLVINSRCGKLLKLFVYNLRRNRLIFCSTLDDKNGLNYYQFLQSGNYLIAFATGYSLIVWNLENGTIVFDELWGHVIEIHADKNLIVLETSKNKLEVYNIETQEIEYQHSGKHSNVDIMDSKIVFTTTNDVIHIVKWVDKSLVTLRCCNKKKIHRLMVKNDLLLSFCKKEASEQVTLCVWNISKKTKLHSTRLGWLYDIRDFCFRNKYLCLFLDKQNVKVLIPNLLEFITKNETDSLCVQFWDYTNGTLAFSINDLKSVITLKNNHCIVDSCSTNVNLFSMTSGEFLYDFKFTCARDSIYSDMVVSDTILFYVRIDKNNNLFLKGRDYEV